MPDPIPLSFVIPIEDQLCQCGSGRRFLQCHGRQDRPTDVQIAIAQAPQAIEIGKLPATRRLDLGCAQNCKEGFEGVDVSPGPGVVHVFDLLTYPWPFESDSIAEIWCSHFIEHIPMEHVDATGRPVRSGAPGARDALLAFFDECYRVLCHGGKITCVVPAHSSDRAVQDPTHRRFISDGTFGYLSKGWRESQKLDHYNVVCDFNGACVPGVTPEVNLRHIEVGHRMIQHERNWVVDWHAKLFANKLPSAPPDPSEPATR